MIALSLPEISGQINVVPAQGPVQNMPRISLVALKSVDFRLTLEPTLSDHREEVI